MDHPGPASTTEPSIQQLLFPDLPCFGCGASNAVWKRGRPR